MPVTHMVCGSGLIANAFADAPKSAKERAYRTIVKRLNSRGSRKEITKRMEDNHPAVSIREAGEHQD